VQAPASTAAREPRRCSAEAAGAARPLFNKQDYNAAERYWSSNYIQHSAHIAPGRDGARHRRGHLPQLNEATHILTTAFDKAWDKFKSSGSALADDACAPSTRALLAKQIIETARKGERNIDRLVENGVAYLREIK
jgi:hypothetical protein